MNETPDAQFTMSNIERSEHSTLGVSRPAVQVGRFVWRILDFLVAGIFLYAGALKAFDPVQFAHDVNNFRILPWTISVALAFYLPWLEILCGVALVFRRVYRGAIAILAALTIVFTLATAAAKVRGLDITCGCFGHASQHWSFPAHLATNLGILAALIAVWFHSAAQRPVAN